MSELTRILESTLNSFEQVANVLGSFHSSKKDNESISLSSLSCNIESEIIHGKLAYWIKWSQEGQSDPLLRGQFINYFNQFWHIRLHGLGITYTQFPVKIRLDTKANDELDELNQSKKDKGSELDPDTELPQWETLNSFGENGANFHTRECWTIDSKKLKEFASLEIPLEMQIEIIRSQDSQYYDWQYFCGQLLDGKQQSHSKLWMQRSVSYEDRVRYGGLHHLFWLNHLSKKEHYYQLTQIFAEITGYLSFRFLPTELLKNIPEEELSPTLLRSICSIYEIAYFQPVSKYIHEYQKCGLVWSDFNSSGEVLQNDYSSLKTDQVHGTLLIGIKAKSLYLIANYRNEKLRFHHQSVVYINKGEELFPTYIAIPYLSITKVWSLNQIIYQRVFVIHDIDNIEEDVFKNISLRKQLWCSLTGELVFDGQLDVLTYKKKNSRLGKNYGLYGVPDIRINKFADPEWKDSIKQPLYLLPFPYLMENAAIAFLNHDIVLDHPNILHSSIFEPADGISEPQVVSFQAKQSDHADVLIFQSAPFYHALELHSNVLYYLPKNFQISIAKYYGNLYDISTNIKRRQSIRNFPSNLTLDCFYEIILKNLIDGHLQINQIHVRPDILYSPKSLCTELTVSVPGMDIITKCTKLYRKIQRKFTMDLADDNKYKKILYHEFLDRNMPIILSYHAQIDFDINAFEELWFCWNDLIAEKCHDLGIERKKPSNSIPITLSVIKDGIHSTTIKFNDFIFPSAETFSKYCLANFEMNNVCNLINSDMTQDIQIRRLPVHSQLICLNEYFSTICKLHDNELGMQIIRETDDSGQIPYIPLYHYDYANGFQCYWTIEKEPLNYQRQLENQQNAKKKKKFCYYDSDSECDDEIPACMRRQIKKDIKEEKYDSLSETDSECENLIKQVEKCHKKSWKISKKPIVQITPRLEIQTLYTFRHAFHCSIPIDGGTNPNNSNSNSNYNNNSNNLLPFSASQSQNSLNRNPVDAFTDNQQRLSTSVELANRPSSTVTIGKKAVVTRTGEPCIVRLRIPENSHTIMGERGDKLRSSHVKIEWIRPVKIHWDENNLNELNQPDKVISITYLSDHIESECQICMDRLVSHIAVPCRHKACEQCWSKQQELSLNCLVCRGHVDRLLGIKTKQDTGQLMPDYQSYSLPEAISFVANDREIETFAYRYGDEIKIPDFCDDINKRCANGIHYCLTDQDAAKFFEFLSIPESLKVLKQKQEIKDQTEQSLPQKQEIKDKIKEPIQLQQVILEDQSLKDNKVKDNKDENQDWAFFDQF